MRTEGSLTTMIATRPELSARPNAVHRDPRRIRAWLQERCSLSLQKSLAVKDPVIQFEQHNRGSHRYSKTRRRRSNGVSWSVVEKGAERSLSAQREKQTLPHRHLQRVA